MTEQDYNEYTNNIYEETLLYEEKLFPTSKELTMVAIRAYAHCVHNNENAYWEFVDYYYNGE